MFCSWIHSHRTHAHTQRSWIESELFQAPDRKIKLINENRKWFTMGRMKENCTFDAFIVFRYFKIPLKGNVRQIIIKIRQKKNKTKKSNQWEESVFGTEWTRWRFVEVTRWVLLDDYFFEYFHSDCFATRRDIVCDVCTDTTHQAEWFVFNEWNTLKTSSSYCV